MQFGWSLGVTACVNGVHVEMSGRVSIPGTVLEQQLLIEHGYWDGKEAVQGCRELPEEKALQTLFKLCLYRCCIA